MLPSEHHVVCSAQVLSTVTLDLILNLTAANLREGNDFHFDLSCKHHLVERESLQMRKKKREVYKLPSIADGECDLAIKQRTNKSKAIYLSLLLQTHVQMKRSFSPT